MTTTSDASRLTTERLNAFSDGVLAIVVTILVLDIHVPERSMSERAVLEFLREVEHDVLVYAASFWLVGVYWLVHHVITGYVRYVNHRLLLANLLFLFTTTLLPFLTKLKNSFPEDPYTAQVFGLGHLACGLSLLLVWRTVWSRPELQARPVRAVTRGRLRKGLGLGAAVALVASSAAHLDPRLCSYLLPLVPAVYAFVLFRAEPVDASP